MGLANCMWCESEIRASSKSCPECGLDHPISAVPATRAKQAARSSRRLFLSLLAVPLMLSVAYAAHSHFVPAADGAVITASSTPVPPGVTDPVQRGVWLNGERALRLALANPSFDGFQQSYVQTSAGQLVSFCGTIPTGSFTGMRFLSIAGDSARTVIEGRDPGFATLWARLCGPTASA